MLQDATATWMEVHSYNICTIQADCSTNEEISFLRTFYRTPLRLQAGSSADQEMRRANLLRKNSERRHTGAFRY